MTSVQTPIDDGVGDNRGAAPEKGCGGVIKNGSAGTQLCLIIIPLVGSAKVPACGSTEYPSDGAIARLCATIRAHSISVVICPVLDGSGTPSRQASVSCREPALAPPPRMASNAPRSSDLIIKTQPLARTAN